MIVGAEPVAAEPVTGDELECGFKDCPNPADYRVEIRRDGGSRKTMVCCDRCSRANAIHVRGNDLLDREGRELSDSGWEER